jgi:uncharacterized RDD family membrane protein YckC
MPDPTAVMGRRILAYIIDALIGGAIALAIIVPLFMSSSETAPSGGAIQCNSSSNSNSFGSNDFNNNDFNSGSPAICFDNGTTVRYIPKDKTGAFVFPAYLIGFASGLLNLVILQGITGASIGKYVTGLRVVGKDGQTAGIGRAILRYLLMLVDGFCCALVGLISSFTSKGHRRIGDMAAGTFVVRKDQAGRPLNVPGVTGGYGTPGYAQGYSGYGQPGWPAGAAAPGQPGGWAPPATGGGAPQGGAPGATAATGEGPTWDAARNAYIQYDREQAAWVQWSDDAKAWRPIDT